MTEFSIDQNLSPRKWQHYAIEAWDFRMRGIAKIVTGGGKTIFSFFCMKRFFEKYPNGNCIIIVPTISLMDQWYVELLENTSLSENQIALHGGGQKSNSNEIVHLMVINTARKSSHYISKKSQTLMAGD